MKLIDPALAGVPALLPRRVALVSDHASPLAAPGSVDCGGQNVYVAQLARELALAGCEVDVFTRRDAPRQKQLVQWRDRVRIVHVPAGPARHVPKERLLPCIPAFARFVVRFARQQRRPYDIVHANFFMSGIVARHLKEALGIPFVITFHALGQVRRLAQGTADAFPPERAGIEAGLMRAADRIVAECQQDRLDMETLYGASPERIAIVPCGFDPGELWPTDAAQARALLGLEQDRFTILQLGRIVPRKGVDTVIEATALLRAVHGVDARLMVVGGDAQEGPEMARLRALAAAQGIAAHVHFAGQQPRPRLRHWYGAADAFATTPWYEPFGITPVEAMACARPVVGAEVGGIKSTVVDGVTGFLVPPRDPQALAERLLRLQRDPQTARAMGAAGLRRAWREYTWRTVARQLMAVYAAVLADARAPIDTHRHQEQA